MFAKLLDFLTLNYPALKGVRTVAGLIGWFGPQVVDHLLNSSMCATDTPLCLTLKVVSAWFLAMGIRGK